MSKALLGVPFRAAFLAVAVALGAAACEREGPAERAGESIDKGVERAGESVERAGDRAEKKLER